MARTVKKILVVDDDPEITEMIEEMLKAEHYEVISAYDGATAVEKANQHQPDLILMDNRIPFFSGLWFCDIFKKKQNTKHIPIVIISSALDDQVIQKANELGASGCLKKPFRMEELLETVSKHTHLV